MIKNNPYKLLQEEGKTKDQLSQVTLQALSIYDETVEDIKKHPDQKSLLELAEQIGTEAIRLVKEEISSLDKTGKDTEEQKEKPEDKQKETHPPKPSPQKLENLKKLQLEIKDLEQELEKCTQEGTLKKKAKQPQKPRKKTSQDVKVARNL